MPDNVKPLKKISSVVLSARRPIGNHGYKVVRCAISAGFRNCQAFPPVSQGNQTQDYLSAIRFALKDEDADLIVIFEDDVDIALGLENYLRMTYETIGAGAGFFSPYSPGIYQTQSAYTAGAATPWRRLGKSCKLIGACCLAFPRQSARLILDDPRAADAIRDHVPIEEYLLDWARRTSRPVWFHLPSLISHKVSDSARDRSIMRHESKFESVAPESLSMDGDGSMRVGLLMPCLCVGGAERYHMAVARWTPGIRWVGCGLASNVLTVERAVDEMATIMPVMADASVPGRHVQHYNSEQAMIRELSHRSDAIVTWGIPHLQSLLDGFGGPIVAVAHGESQWTVNWVVEAMKKATHLVACGPDAGKLDVGRPFDAVMSCGVELDRIAPTRDAKAIRQEWQIPAGVRCLGYVGRFSDDKNPLHTARVVRELGPKFMAVYHGMALENDDDFRRRCFDESDGRAIFLGPEYHTGDVYQGIDCLMIGSEHEGGPMVAVEAWLMGTPVVSTPVGIVKRNPEWSTIVEHGQPMSAWADAVRIALEEATPADADRIRRQAMPRFCAASLGRQWAEFLKSLR